MKRHRLGALTKCSTWVLLHSAYGLSAGNHRQMDYLRLSNSTGFDFRREVTGLTDNGVLLLFNSLGLSSQTLLRGSGIKRSSRDCCQVTAKRTRPRFSGWYVTVKDMTVQLCQWASGHPKAQQLIFVAVGNGLSRMGCRYSARKAHCGGWKRANSIPSLGVLLQITRGRHPCRRLQDFQKSWRTPSSASSGTSIYKCPYRSKDRPSAGGHPAQNRHSGGIYFKGCRWTEISDWLQWHSDLLCHFKHNIRNIIFKCVA